jgi:hypothetical protein
MSNHYFSSLRPVAEEAADTAPPPLMAATAAADRLMNARRDTPLLFE